MPDKSTLRWPEVVFDFTLQGSSYKQVDDHCFPTTLPTLSGWDQDQGMTGKPLNCMSITFQNVNSSAGSNQYDLGTGSWEQNGEPKESLVRPVVCVSALLYYLHS